MELEKIGENAGKIWHANQPVLTAPEFHEMLG